MISGVYVDKNGTVTYIKDSSYNTEKQAVFFETNHFSIFGVGTKVTPEVKASYAKLQLKGTAEGKTNHVSWNKVSGATEYILYAAPCGVNNLL